MNFLKNWTIDLKKLPKYAELNRPLEIDVDVELGKLLVADERIQRECRDEFEKTLSVVKTNKLAIKLNPRRGYGRRYADVDKKGQRKYYGSLVAYPKKIKNTFFTYHGWVDIDQRKGHPTILLAVAKKNKMNLPAYREYLNNFDSISQEIAFHHSANLDHPITKADIKYLFNRTIYGGGISTWFDDMERGTKKRLNGIVEYVDEKEIKNKDNLHPFYQRFLQETQMIIDLVYSSNAELVQVVCTDLMGEDQLYERKKRTMSFFCQIIENDITWRAFKLLQEYGCIKNRVCDWGYDGLTFPFPPEEINLESILVIINNKINEDLKTEGICFVIKPLEGALLDVIERRKEIVPPEDPIMINISTLAAGNRCNGSGVAFVPLDDYLDWKQNFEQRFFKVRNPPLVVEKVSDSNGKVYKYNIHDQAKFASIYKDQKVGKNIDGSSRFHGFPIIPYWLEDETSVIYDEMNYYPPPKPCQPNHFNLWIPFPYEGLEFDSVNHPDFDNDGVLLFLQHFKLLCGKDDIMFDYKIKWLAHMFQNPGEKPGTMLSFVSLQGTGKNTFLEIIKCLVNAKRVFETTNPERDVLGHFNSPLKDSYLVNLSEVDFRNLAQEGQLKGMITDGDLTINEKYKPQITITSYHRFILFSNNDKPVRTSDDDRRNAISCCSVEKKGDFAYFEKLHALKNERTLRSLYTYFKHLDLSNFNIREAPKSEFHKDLIQATEHPILSFLKSFVKEHRDKEWVMVQGKEMLQFYENFRKEMKFQYEDKIDVRNFGRKIKTIIGNEELCPSRDTGKCTVRTYFIQKIMHVLKIDPNNIQIDEWDDECLYPVDPRFYSTLKNPRSESSLKNKRLLSFINVEVAFKKPEAEPSFKRINSEEVDEESEEMGWATVTQP